MSVLFSDGHLQEQAKAQLDSLLYPIRTLFKDRFITEVMANPDGSVWVKHQKEGLVMTKFTMTISTREAIINVMASLADQEMSEDYPGVVGSPWSRRLTPRVIV